MEDKQYTFVAYNFFPITLDLKRQQQWQYCTSQVPNLAVGCESFHFVEVA